jgi:hypothetical protein
MTPRTEVIIRENCAIGDPIELTLKVISLTLRHEDAKNNRNRGCFVMIFAHVGNQKQRKTPLFNQLTGSKSTCPAISAV